MSQNAVGFYWTLPVPWVRFTSLPKAVDDAAKLSRTIRYQRDLIRRYAADESLQSSPRGGVSGGVSGSRQRPDA